MINALKTFAFFGCSLTSRYRQGLCKSFNSQAKKLNVNMVYFNALGKIGEKNTEDGEREADLIDYIDIDRFDGIIYDGEGYNAKGAALRVIDKLKHAKCPVVSISSHVDGFHNIDFEDASGIRSLIEHFTDVHGHTRIGFMSGFLTHHDARLRLAEFRAVMKEKGLPEDGAGVFEGDFWFHKGEEAADFFLSQPERPQSIVCANDYMAIAIISAFKLRGIRVPEDIAVSGYDGTIEGRQYVPHITTATREREYIAGKAMDLLYRLSCGEEDNNDYIVCPRTIITQSCGCQKVDHKAELQNINDIYKDIRLFGYCLNDAEAAMLKLSKVDRLCDLEAAFRECATNFGDYSSFFLFMQTDREGNLSCTDDFVTPDNRFRPVIWIDTKNEYDRTDADCARPLPIPATDSDIPHFFYIMSTYCSERMFGYALIEMKDDDIFNDFYNIFILDLSVTIDRLWKNDRINKLYEEQKKLYENQRVLSISDELTGMLNRRGFDHFSRKALRSLKDRTTVCTMVIDMDGLKFINDEYGHNEGDFSIRIASNIIMDCCTSDEICGRTGGDEFYVFAADYSQEKLERFTSDLETQLEKYNAGINRPYKVELSWGSCLAETDSKGDIDSLLRISDERMYEQKMAKPNRRTR